MMGAYFTPFSPNGFLSLSNELKYKIFDELTQVGKSDDDIVRSAAFGRSNYDPSTFLDIAQAVPTLLSICEQYIYQWPPDVYPAYKVLQKVLVDQPELGWRVRGLDLMGAVNRQGHTGAQWPTSREEVKDLLRIAEGNGYPTEDFELEGLFSWIGLAFHLLPNLRSIRFHDGPFGGPTPQAESSGWNSLVRRIVANQGRYLRNIHHIAIGVDGYQLFPTEGGAQEFFNVETILSDLLDFPSLKSLELVSIARGPANRIIDTDLVEDPEALRRSTCTHFYLDQSFVTSYELSIIGARCKPQVLVMSPAYPIDRPGRYGGESDEYGFLLNTLRELPRFVEHLEELDIWDFVEVFNGSPPCMLAEREFDLIPFQNLRTVSTPIHTLFGWESSGYIDSSNVLPPSLERLTLESSTSRGKGVRWLEGNYLSGIYYLLHWRPERFPKLKKLSVDISVLVSDDKYIEGIFSDSDDDMERFRGVLRLVRDRGIALLDIESGEEVRTGAGTFQLVGKDSSCCIQITIAEDGQITSTFVQ